MIRMFQNINIRNPVYCSIIRTDNIGHALSLKLSHLLKSKHKQLKALVFEVIAADRSIYIYTILILCFLVYVFIRSLA